MNRLLVVLALVAGLLGIGGSPASAAPSMCQVKNLTTGVTYNGNLQSAINAASDGDTIRVRGVCVGNFSIPGTGSLTNLTLVGQPGHSLRSTLDGNGTGTVLSVNFVTSPVHVRLRDLRVTGGGAGGIINFGDLTLSGRSSVTGNSGIGIFTAGGLTLNDRSSVSSNTGGGIDDEGGATLNDRSSVTNNTAVIGGGIFDDDTGLALNDHALVSGNTAQFGGGIFEVGHLTLSRQASVIHNTATVSGGGIVALGGLDVCPDWTGAISPNTPDDPPPVIPVTC